MTGAEITGLGICDVHPGVHRFRNDDDAPCCIGWQDYEPFIKPGDRPQAVSELDDHRSENRIILVTPDMLREIADELAHHGSDYRRTLQTTTGEFIDLQNMDTECSACGDTLDVRDADDKYRCEQCHDADIPPQPQYKHTHESVHDQSPAMSLGMVPGGLMLMNECGDTWVSDPKAWREIG